MFHKCHSGPTLSHEAAAEIWQQPFAGAVILYDGAGKSHQLKSYMRCDAISDALIQLAESVCLNPLWYEMEEATLVGREYPQPMLAVFGHFSPFELARLRDLATLIRERFQYHRYIGYAEAEEAAQQLACELVSRYGKDALSRFQFTAIPRGGVIVLGILSYLLDLRSDQVLVASNFRAEGEALVVVDDCSLSGYRFQDFIKNIDASRVIFCLLCAVPDLCRIIELREPRVEACFTAIGLSDIGTHRFGNYYSQWREEQQRLIGGSGYWVGISQPVSFAWSEPQTLYWNGDRKAYAAGWNIMPPHLCLKRRVLAGEFEKRSDVTDIQKSIVINKDVMGSIQATSRVLWVKTGSVIAIARIPETAESVTCFHLDGVAADMWESLMLHGSIDKVCESLAGHYDVNDQVLRHDLSNFVDDLIGNGILTRGNSAPV